MFEWGGRGLKWTYLIFLYGIVFLENLNFHDRTYRVKAKLISTNESISVLHIETIVHHSLGPDYFANILISDQYKVLNQKPFKGSKPPEGYLAYKMDMKRKYRDVLSTKNFLIIPNKTKTILPTPIIVMFENMKQHLYTNKNYILSTKNKVTELDGPEIAEAIFPQKFGM